MTMPPLLLSAVLVPLALLAPLAAGLGAAEVLVPWTLPAGAPLPTVAVSPLKYGKAWAYAVEIDDGPASALSVVAPLLERGGYTDAPPGVPGGTPRPLVGTLAAMVLCVGGGNATYLDWQQLRELQRRGWGIVNHSYWHTGNHWDPSARLAPADFARELFWSQALLAALLGDGRAPCHFVYPNGDFNYAPQVAAAGMLSASRVGGPTTRSDGDLLQLGRSYLDENVWSKTPDILHDFPATRPADGAIVIDFTHGIDQDPASANQRRWRERLAAIVARHGSAGDDSLWGASTEEIVAYVAAARVAKVDATRAGMRIVLPDGVPGGPLTVRIEGLPEAATVTAPGASLHRRGRSAWLTTAAIGRPGVPPPGPAIALAYRGAGLATAFATPVRVAGVRVRQAGPVAAGYRLAITCTTAAGERVAVPVRDHGLVKDAWGLWLLAPAVPDIAPIAGVVKVEVAADPALKEIEVWSTP